MRCEEGVWPGWGDTVEQHPMGGSSGSQHPTEHGDTGELPGRERDASDDDSGDGPEILPAPILTDVG